MPPKLAESQTPKGLMRLLFRIPILLYHAHLGWLMGNRFLLLKHIGRKSGKTREVVLEVVRYDKSSGTHIVASGWGEKSDWFRNIQKTPDVIIQSGGRSMRAKAVRLSEREARLELRDYARRHPSAFRYLGRFMLGDSISDSDEDISLLAQTIPLVAFVPVEDSQKES